jgi:HK97 family phage prohead protease
MTRQGIFPGALLTKEAPPKGLEIKLDVFAFANDAELKAALGDEIPDGYVAGWASTKDLDLYGHVVEHGAFTESMSARGLTGPKGIKFLKGHDRDWPLGVIKVLEYRGERLWIEAQFNLDITYAKDLWHAVKMNGGFSFSVGFYLQEYSWKQYQKDPEVEYLYITKGDLFEVSVVPFAGNPEAVMTYVKEMVKDNERGNEITTPAQFEKALVAAGLVKSREDAHRCVLLMKQNIGVFKTSDPPPVDEPDPQSPVLDEAQAANVMALLQSFKSNLHDFNDALKG